MLNTKHKILKVKIIQNKLVDWILNKISNKSLKIDGLTIGRLIFIRKNYLDITLLAHELVHVLQYNQIGFFKFIYKYLKYNNKYGYRKNPFEIEAYKKQSSLFFRSWAKNIIDKVI